MANARLAVLALMVASLVSACQPAVDVRFRAEGIGSELYTPELVASTANLRAYFDLLCNRADITPPGSACNTAGLTQEQWRRAVYAAYNDIDERCDRYIDWLEEKRNERLFGNQTLSALTGLLGGLTVATGAAQAIGYVALALGFGTTVYNAYQETLFHGVEVSTIKAVVGERRRKFRLEFQDAAFAYKPDAEYTLRAYLRICTPASITMDVNTATRSSVTGQPNPQEHEIQEQRNSLLYIPTRPEQPVTEQRTRGPIQMSPVLKQIFAGTGWTQNQLLALQAAFCIPEGSRGRADPETIANVNLLMSGTERYDARNQFRVNEAKYRALQRDTGLKCDDPNRHKNYWENWKYRNVASEQKLLAKIVKELDEKIQVPSDFNAPEARALIGRARVKCGLENATGQFVNQVTKDLETRLADPKKCG